MPQRYPEKSYLTHLTLRALEETLNSLFINM